MVIEPQRVNNDNKVTVEFTKGASDMKLCVSTNGVDFDLKPNVTMTVVEVESVVSELVMGLQEEVTIPGTGLDLATEAFFIAVAGRRLDAAVSCVGGERVSTIAKVQDGLISVTITKPVDRAQLCLVFPDHMAMAFLPTMSVVYMDEMPHISVPNMQPSTQILPLHNIPVFGDFEELSKNEELCSKLIVETMCESDSDLKDLFLNNTFNNVTLVRNGADSLSLTLRFPEVMEVDRVEMTAMSNETSPKSFTVSAINAAGEKEFIDSKELDNLEFLDPYYERVFDNAIRYGRN